MTCLMQTTTQSHACRGLPGIYLALLVSDAGAHLSRCGKLVRAPTRAAKGLLPGVSVDNPILTALDAS